MNNLTMQKLGVACWTIGQHAQKNIIPAIDNCDGVDLIGAYTRNENVLDSVCSETGCKRYSDEQELLLDPDVDLVYLSSPTGIHYEQIKKCLTAKKSVLVEKTALTDLQKVDEIIALAKSNGVLVMEAFMYRFHSQFKRLQDLLNSKKYGEIVRIECEFGFPHLPKGDIRYSKALEGGSLYDAGAYTLSAAQLLLGHHPDVKWARRCTEAGYEVDTFGNAILVNDINQIALCNWKFGASYINQIRIWLEQAHIVVDRAFSKPETYQSNIVVYHNGKVEEEIISGTDNHFVNMFSYVNNIIMTSNFELEYQNVYDQVKIFQAIVEYKS